MMNTMNYKGYTAKIEFDPRDNIFWGKVLGIRDSITFEGSTVEELAADFHNAIDFYQSDCAASGRTPQKPVSGKLLLRVPPEVHRAAIVAAQAAGTSLNCGADAARFLAAQVSLGVAAFGSTFSLTAEEQKE